MFAVGDKVEIIDDSIQGTIVKIKEEVYVVKTDDGFELDFFANELILMYNEDKSIDEASSFCNIEKSKVEKNIKSHHRVNTEKKSRKEEYVVEVDLHIEKLIKDYRKMTSFEILNYQLDIARYQLENAIKNRVSKLVFIHGEGDGVLKLEIEYLLGRYPEVSFREANYRKYGLGATEIYIKQNV